MGKKSKKNKNIWDLTAEEQQKQLDDFAEFERGDVNIMTLVGKKVPTFIDDNGFSAGLEEVIINDMRGKNKRKEYYSNQYEYDNEYVYSEKSKCNYHQSNDKAPNTSKLDVIQSDDELPIRTFAINISARLATLHRLIVDDGLCPTVVSLDMVKDENFNEDIEIDASNAADICELLMSYIITLKHPSAIYEIDDFLNTDFWKFGRVKDGKYNTKKYKFYVIDNYVLCYYIDLSTISIFNELVSANYSSTISEILKVYMVVAYAVGTLHQAFWADTEDYVQKFFKDKELNKQKEFHKLFVSDESTELVNPREKETDEDGVDVPELDEIQYEARKILSELSGTNYYGDGDYDDDLDDEEDDLEDDEELTPEESESEEIYSDLVDEDTEFVETEETADNSDNDNMVFPVIKKNK